MKKLLLTTTALLSLTACQVYKTEKVSVPKAGIEITELQKQNQLNAYGISNLKKVQLENTMFFFWKPSFSSEQVATAKKASNEIEKLEKIAYDLQYRQQAPINKQIEALQATIDQISAEVTALNEQVKTAQAEKTAEEQKPEPDQNKIAELVKTIEALTKEVELKVAASDKLAAQRDVLQAQSDELMLKLVEIADAYEKQTNLLGSAVDDLTKLDTVVIEATEDGSLKIKLNGWDNKSYSTDKKTISLVKFSEDGGVIEFQVFTNPGESYSFKVMRTNFNDEFGRVFFKGEVVREDKRVIENGKPLRRLGVVIMTDKRI